MKTATLQLPAVPDMPRIDSGILAPVADFLRRTSGAAMPLSETERTLRDAQSRRAAYLASK